MSALLTDLYQLTMACGYWREGLAERDAVFHVFFRRAPFGGQHLVACGVDAAIECAAGLGFAEEELAYLAGLTAPRGGPLFPPAFVDFLREVPPVEIDAVAEGTVLFADEPLVRVRGPLWAAQLLETALLNQIGFATQVATKAARVCRAAGGAPVLEFGVRRAPAAGGLTASRAAFVGGCAATSNLLAGQRFGIPVRGTHAHSWVQCFADEREAFAAYARAFPDGCVLLVDTYDTRRGVARAAEVGHALRAGGHELAGVRLDSGDLAELARDARRLLDDAGLEGVRIVASGDLDEDVVAGLVAAGAPIDVFGVGTRLATAHGDTGPSCVYKLAAIADERGALQPRRKQSDDPAKATTPAPQQVRRYLAAGRPVADDVHEVGHDPDGHELVPRGGRPAPLPPHDAHVDLLRPALRRGGRLREACTASAARDRARAELASFDDRHLRLRAPVPYLVGRARPLADLEARLAHRPEDRR